MTMTAMADLDTRQAPRDAGIFSMRGRVVIGVLFAVLLLGGVGGWAVTAKLSGAVIGQGTVKVDEDLKIIQHLDGGVVRDIAVHAGDWVAAGQVLLRLDDTQARAENAILTNQITELEARRLRLLAERDGLAALSVPDEFSRSGTQAILAIDGERQLFASNLDYHNAQLEQAQLQIGQLKQEILGLEAQRDANVSELDLAGADRDRLRSLATNQLVEATRLSAAEREAVRLQGQVGEITAAIARAQSRISELQFRIMGMESDRRTVSQRELRSVDAQLQELRERQHAAEARLERIDIIAPVSGVINELNVSTLGGVVAPAERLLSIVPDDADLTIEFRVAVTDIDQVTLGKEATLRFSAFNQRVTPEARGVISRVGAAAQLDAATGQSYYTAEIEVTEQAVDAAELVPGMPVEVFVQTDEQSAIAYFAKPFTDQVARAFREE